MIKSLLEPDEKQPEEIKIETEEKMASDSAIDENFNSYFSGIESPLSETSESETLSEISEPADDELIFLEKPEETINVQSLAETTGNPFDFSRQRFNQPENSFAEKISYEPIVETSSGLTNDEPLAGFPNDEINFDLPVETTIEKPNFESAAGISNETANPALFAEITGETTNSELPVEAKTEKSKIEDSGLLFQPPAEPESMFETARQSGLAYAAAITLFASVVFMLIIGWLADWLFGSSPWGVVGGIVLGAAIGFIQFFRITSQIFKNKN